MATPAGEVSVAPPPPGGEWKERIVARTAAGGVVGAGFGLLSGHRARLGAARAAATYAANLAIIAGCYGGACELARDARGSTPDDPMNSIVGGLASGAVLGRFQGGHLGAMKYAGTFAAVGSALDYAVLKLRPQWDALKERFSGDKDWLTLPEWSPIQVLDEEALAKKRAREEQLFAQRALGKLNKEEP